MTCPDVSLTAADIGVIGYLPYHRQGIGAEISVSHESPPDGADEVWRLAQTNDLQDRIAQRSQLQPIVGRSCRVYNRCHFVHTAKDRMATAPTAEPKTQEYEFEQMNLQVGGRIQFITHRTIKPVQHFSTIVGWVKDEYLIVRIPFENGAAIALGEGDKLTIRVFSGVNVCSFSCIVQRVFHRPLFYAHLSFPTAIQGTSLRTAMRVKVDIPAQVSTGDDHVSVFLSNLSVSGALIESPRQLHLDGGNVALSFYLLAQPGNHQVRISPKATIRNINVMKPQPEEKRPVFTYGVQFGELDPVHHTMLQNLTYEALIADRHKIV